MDDNVQKLIDSLNETMLDRSVIDRVWEQEPDREEWTVSCIAIMRVKMHRSKRIDKKWRKLYGFQPKPVQLQCLMIRRPDLLHWCGYVGVPRGHLIYKVHYDRVDAFVHGGLTFGRMDRIKSGYYYVGFDCAHYNDYVPGYEALFSEIGGPPKSYQSFAIYRDYNFVKNETQELANQLMICALNKTEGIENV